MLLHIQLRTLQHPCELAVSKTGQPTHIDWPILLSANFLLLNRQNTTFWSLLSAGFFHYCRHRCQAVLAGISVYRRPSGSPLLGVWRPFSVLGEKIAAEVWKIFRQDFVGSAGFLIAIVITAISYTSLFMAWYPASAGDWAFCLLTLLPG